MNKGGKGNINNKPWEADTVNTTMHKRLDFSKINFSKKEITTEEALKDVSPIPWTNDVLKGNKKVIVKKTKE